MLELKHIRKSYATAGFTQVALDDVSVAFRDSEFVAVLGTSGSGKTTMLNILGGLDHADSGDIVINGISTRDYGDKDWDTYRNHRIGFIFQSYNLIPHQSVLSNVELALTLAGISKAERRSRAEDALARVGLVEHMGKRPNQLSGGQMQRVAIARALVNNPDIVLADEPTGALDTDTGLQVMDLLKEIADERLVVMVTHNPELAGRYATRIVRLKDGRIVGDSVPIGADEVPELGVIAPIRAASDRKGVDAPPGGKSPGAPAQAGPAWRPHDTPARHGHHASMSPLTALALSFNNLMTKKGRTFMTAFAGSIGIIGIAAILALSNGVNSYIADTEEQALTSYPLTITKSSFDMVGMMGASARAGDEAEGQGADGVDAQGARADAEGASQEELPPLIHEYTVMSDMFARVKSNDLASFKAYLDSGESGIEPYVNAIEYTYAVTPLIYDADTSSGVVRLNPSKMVSELAPGTVGSSLTGGATMSSFQELPSSREMLERQMEIVAGRWPRAYDEAVLVTGDGGEVSDYTLYSIGVYDTKVMEDMVAQALSGEEVSVPETEGRAAFTVEDALGLHFKVVPAVDLYQKNVGQGTWTDMSGDKAYMVKLLDGAVDLKVVGVVSTSESAGSSMLGEGVAYTPELTKYLMGAAAESQIVAEQLAEPDVDVFTGKTFEELQDDENTLDMDSLFTIDEDMLSQAFSFDASALDALGSGLDLSALDLSGEVSGLDLSGLDLSPMRLDTAQVASLFSEDTMRQIMSHAPTFSLSGVDGIQVPAGGISLTDEQAARLNSSIPALLSDFASWFVQTPEAASLATDSQALMAQLAQAVQQYLQSDSAQQAIASLVEGLGDVSGEAAAQVRQALASYLSDQLVPYLAGALAALDPADVADGLDAAELAQLIEGAPQLDLSGSSFISEEQAERLSQAVDELSAGFAAWLLDNPDLLFPADGSPVDYAALMERYLQTDGAQAILNPLLEDLGASLGQLAQEQIGTAMDDYLQNQFAPYLSQQLGSLMEAAAQALGTQLATELGTQLASQLAAMTGKVTQGLGSLLSGQLMGQMEGLQTAMESGFSFDAATFANAIQFNMTQEDLASLLTNYMKADELSYDANLATLGFAEEGDPESISIYPIDFPSKEAVLDVIDTYNAGLEEAGEQDSTIVYSDIAGVLMSSVTDIVNTISLVLVAFVSISLVVSSIMISVITYISVLERRKEIGILRAMGASKRNVASIFNAETIIEGLFAGVLAIAVVYLASLPVNALVRAGFGVPSIMQLPVESALALIGISVMLTLVAGLIPASLAAHRDPVEALRSE